MACIFKSQQQWRLLARAPISKAVVSAATPTTTTTARCLASAATDAPSPLSPPGERRATSFTDKVNAGPSFADFLAPLPSPLPVGYAHDGHAVEDGGGARRGAEEEATESVVGLRTALVGPPGKKKEITRLPEWLKTPMPAGENYKRIKADLRGLNLHTGK